MTLANCLKLLKHFESLKNSPEAKASVNSEAETNFKVMKEHLVKTRAFKEEAPLVADTKTSVKAKKSA